VNDTTNLWRPSEELIRNSNIAAMQRRLGAPDYDALYRVSLAEPEAYWRAVIDECRVVWRKPFERYVDLTDGVQFPKWFVGGELNWVESVLAWADDPAIGARAAVAAEREAGDIATLSYIDLRSRVRTFATGLKRLGLRRGDRVGLLMENGVEATVSFLAICYIGAVVVALFSGFGPDAIVARLTSCGARAFIATAGFRRRGKLIDTLATVEEAKAKSPDLELLIVKGGEANLGDEVVRWETLADGEASDLPAEQMASNDPFMVIYTSGTTGKPKGAVHVHGGFPLKVAHDSLILLDTKPGDVMLWPVDMGWVGGAMVIAAALMRGTTLVCYDSAPDFPDWSRMGAIVERHRVTHFGAAPTLIRGFAANPEAAIRADLSSIRVLVTAGEAIDPDTFIWHQTHFGRAKAPLINFTGGTEASGALLSSVIVKPISPAGFNTPAPGVEAAVIDSAGAKLIGEVGELAILRPFLGMTRSFWQDDRRYLETYWERTPGIWVHGDLAIRDPDGHFFVRGRSDDTLKLAGKRLGPAEVEDIVMETAAVAEAAAIGVDDPVKGQKLVVFVVPGALLERPSDLERAVTAHVESRLGHAFRPARVHVVGDLPKTRTTKVMRRMIRSAYCGLALGDATALANPAALEEIRAAALERPAS
jgi:acetyl-CoA synthetase